MILIDTSVWSDHFRRPIEALDVLLRQQLILIHPYVVGELAMGSMHDRAAVLEQLSVLVTLMPVRHSEVMTMIERERLFGTGLQYVDAHLLASARITSGCSLWAHDKRLKSAAERLGVAADF